MQKILPKKDLAKFLESLIKKYEVIAPIKEKGNTKFSKIKHSGEIYLHSLTEVPAKKSFFNDNETLFEYKNKKIINNEKQRKRIMFGLRKCDLNALKVTDKLMCDQHYFQKRKSTILLGLYCQHPDEFCFCNSMETDNIEKICDLFFWPNKDSYNISVYTKKGEKLVKNLKNSKVEIKIEYKNKKILKDKDIENDYNNEIWKTDSEKCLSCAACTEMCPTCNCFDLHDSLDINLKNSKRLRTSASCQLKSFSRVAGGKSFRDSRLSRFKHFVYHKMVYYKKHHDKYMCVGCGRCLRVCPTHIDWTDTINLLKENENLK